MVQPSANITDSASVVKLRYPNGKLPKSVYQRAKAKFLSLVERREDWTGGNWIVALQNENPQGLGVDVPTAQGSLAQGSYKNFSVPRTSYYGVARVKGEALLAVQGDDGALVDLWMNEMQGVSMALLIELEIQALGNGTGVRGQIASGQGTATVTLTAPTDTAKFALNMRVQVVDVNTLSPTVQGGIGTVSAIDRDGGTVTISSGTWASTCGASASQYIIRCGDAAASGTGKVMAGWQQWIVGSTAGTLFGLDRSVDPTRLGGLAFDATGFSRENAIIEASSRVNQQGAPQPTVGLAHPRDIGDFKKQLGAKVMYPKVKQETRIAGVSFSGIEVEGDEDKITLLSSPFVPRNGLFLTDPDSFTIRSLRAAPHLQNYDSLEFVRMAGDDSYEVRFVAFDNEACNMPFANCSVSSWGL